MQKFLRIKQVCEKTGLSIPYIYKMMKEDKFPRSIPLGKRAVGWNESDIVKWQASRLQLQLHSQWNTNINSCAA